MDKSKVEKNRLPGQTQRTVERESENLKELEEKYGYGTVSTGIAAKLFKHDGKTRSPEWIRHRLECGDLVDGAPSWNSRKRPTVESVAKLLGISAGQVYEKVEEFIKIKQ